MSVLVSSPVIYAQKHPGDTVKSGSAQGTFVEQMQQFAKRSAKESAEEFAADKAAIAQVRIFENIRKTMQMAKIYLQAGLDTSEVRAELSQIQKDFIIAGDGVLTNRGTSQTFRNLTATSKIVSELLNKTTARKLQVDKYKEGLNNYRYHLDSLLSLPDLFSFPKDSVVLAEYIQQLRVIAYQLHPIDSSLNRAASNAQKLANEVNLKVTDLQVSLEEIELHQKKMGKGALDREFHNLWQPSSAYRPFNQIFDQAKAKGLLTLKFYLQNNLAKLSSLIVLFLGVLFYLRSLKAAYIRQEILSKTFDGQLVLRSPVAAAVLIVVCLFQFIFFSPPFLFNVVLWIAASLSLSVIFRGFITSYWMKVWLTMVFLFLIASLDNLILQASRSERWFMLALSASGIIAGTVILLGGRKPELKERLILVTISIMILVEFAAALANLFGRYNLSKALLISGYLNVVIAILFLWTVRLINEALYLGFNVYTQQDAKFSFVNFDKVGKKVPGIFYVFLVLGWAILCGRNFAGFDYFFDPLYGFLTKERTLGNYTFSINNLLLFVIIMGIAAVVSKIVSFFASDWHFRGDKKHHNEKQGLGSWLLLIRIFILSSGLFLAIAATGIPLDRITIILGALGVGIGFGLQALVNNLVSGLIIAFEKPVNVGDIVEIGGRGGTVKSIGFRSSIISTWEGADVVMPNGDLLNEHLINWSLSGGKRQIIVPVGVAYDTQLKKAKELLDKLLEESEEILKSPAPAVLYEKFADSAIELKIIIWIRDFRESGKVKSNLIMTITEAFRANNVTIPYPQQDLYLHPTELFKEKK